MQAQQVLRQRFPGMEVIPSTYPVSPQKARSIPISRAPSLLESSNPAIMSRKALLSNMHHQARAHKERPLVNVGAAGKLNNSEGPEGSLSAGGGKAMWSAGEAASEVQLLCRRCWRGW